MPKSKLSGLFNRRRRRDGDSSPTPTQTSEQVSNTNPNEPALQNPSEATATSVDSKTSNDSDAVSEKLWSRAFELLRDREETLVDDYERCLNEKGILGLQEPPIRSGVLFKPGFVKDVVQTFKNDREKKQWTFSLKGKDHKLRDQLEKLVKLLVFSDSILKQATSAQPYAALAWSTASVFLPLVSGSLSNAEAMVKGFATVLDNQSFWKFCEDTYLRSSASQRYEELVEPLSKVYSFFLEYQIRAICHLSRKQLSRAWQNVGGWSDWGEKEKEIIKISDNCLNRYIPVLQQKEIRSNGAAQNKTLDEMLNTVREYRLEDQETEILRALREATSDYKTGKRSNPKPVNGTCQWFFNDVDFCIWRDGDFSGVFWIAAGPGCGKSVLARALVDDGHLESSTVTVDVDGPESTTITSTNAATCYYFFKDDDSRRTTSVGALCAILHQLFCHQSTSHLVKVAMPEYRQNHSALLQNFDDLWEILVKCAQATSVDIVCVLDALDECNRSDRNHLIDTLEQFYASDNSLEIKRLKFLVTSRPYEDIVASFRLFAHHGRYFRFDGDQKHNEISHDIERVIDDRMKTFSDFDAQDRLKIAEALRSGGTKTYLWLHLTLDIIKSNSIMFRRLDDVDELLTHIPSKVSDAYEKILSRTPDERITGKLLQIMLAATRPLTLEEANCALTLALDQEGSVTFHDELLGKRWKNDFETIVKNFGGLIINLYDGKLSFIHLTAREFLLESSQSNSRWQGRFADGTALHSTVARCCMRYLLLEEFVSHALICTGYMPQYPLLEYASISWIYHFKKQEIHATGADRQLKYWFLGQCTFTLSNWTDLALASRLGFRFIVEEILDGGRVDINQRSTDDVSALQSSAATGHTAIVNLLLSKGADVNICNGNCLTALSFAVVGKDRSLITLLLANGADPMLRSGFDEMTALEVAAVTSKELFLLLLHSAFKTDVASAVRMALSNTAFVRAGGRALTIAFSLLGEHELENNFLDDKIVQNVMGSAQSGYQESIVQFLEQRGREHLLFDPQILSRFASLSRMGAVLQECLRSSNGASIHIITADILAVVAEEYDPETMKTFLQHSSRKIIAANSLFVASASNEQHAASMAELLLDFLGDEVEIDEGLLLGVFKATQEIVQVGGRYVGQTTAKFVVSKTMLEDPHCKISTTPRLLRYALRAFDGSMQDEETWRGQTLITELLLEKGISSGVMYEELFLEVARYGDVETLQLLVARSLTDFIPNQELFEAAVKNDVGGLSIIHFMRNLYGLDKVVITANLLASVANFNFTDITEWKPSEVQNVAIPSLLIFLEWKPEIRLSSHPLLYDTESFNFFTPTQELFLAVLGSGKVMASYMIRLLLSNFSSSFEVTDAVLQMAAGHVDSLELLMLMKSWRPDNFIVSHEIVKTAATAGRTGTLNYLARNSGGNFTIEDVWYRLAEFRNAVLLDRVEVVQRMLSEGVDVGAVNIHGQTVLHVLAQLERPKCLRLLLGWPDLYIDAVDQRGWTALHQAVDSGSAHNVEILLGKGADPHRTTSNGDTILSIWDSVYATGQDWLKIEALLKQALVTSS